jgi:AraC-like DNA-binding protein
MHLVLAHEGSLAVAVGRRVTRAAGVLTAPDALHGIDARGTRVLLAFVDPESEVGRALSATLRAPVRLLSERERDAIGTDHPPMDLMGAGGPPWLVHVARTLGAPGATGLATARTVHPRVKKVLRILRTGAADTSLEALAAQVDLSKGRLMHVFTESIGVPLRPYLAWLRLQRAAAGIVSGRALTDVALEAGFSDAAHMSRTFRRSFGMTPSLLRPMPAAASATLRSRRATR